MTYIIILLIAFIFISHTILWLGRNKKLKEIKEKLKEIKLMIDLSKEDKTLAKIRKKLEDLL